MINFQKNITKGTILKRLRAYNAVTDNLFTCSLFIYIYHFKIEPDKYMSSPGDMMYWDNYRRFATEKGLMSAMAIFLIYLFVTWRQSARIEIEIGSNLFSRPRTPQDWQEVKGAKLILFMILGFHVLFIFLAMSIDNMTIFSTSMACLYMISTRSQIMRRRNLREYFSDKKLFPSDSDEHKEFILRRRIVIKRYLFDNPHIGIKIFVLIVCLLTFVASTANSLFKVSIWEEGWAYSIMLVGMTINDRVTARWQRDRDQSLNTIEEDQERADIARIGDG